MEGARRAHDSFYSSLLGCSPLKDFGSGPPSGAPVLVSLVTMTVCISVPLEPPEIGSAFMSQDSELLAVRTPSLSAFPLTYLVRLLLAGGWNRRLCLHLYLETVLSHGLPFRRAGLCAHSFMPAFLRCGLPF